MASPLLGFAAVALLLANDAGDERARIDLLIEQLSSDDSWQQANAACGLGRLGRVASRAAPALAAVLQRRVLDNAAPASARSPRQSPDSTVDHCELVREEMWQRALTRRYSERDWFESAWSRGP